MDQRLVVRPSSRSYRHDGRKIQPRVPCSSHFPINPKPYRNRNKQNDDVRRKSCVEVSELINTSTSCSSKRYLLSDAPFVDWVSRYKDDLAPAHPSKYQVVVLRVSLHCKGCEGKVRKHISKMEGGSSPSERIVAGTIVHNTQPNPTHNNLPFSKPRNRIFPNTNIPFPGDDTNTIIDGGTVVITDIGTQGNVVVNERGMLPFVKPGTLPLGATVLDKVVFGRITVIDYQVTEGPDLGGSQVVGKAQGFHLASSLDGSSKTMAFTVLFGDDEEESVSLFGVHRTAAIQSSIAVVGGTGKYGNAKGYAILETLPLSSDQQLTTNGVHTVLNTTLYLTL
ncbi:dirigent protein 24-like [Senna tora]|uniref:Dirigent protein n=1 Tax=Senna tora TaxID=362788 RepID=A0A834SN07_9FABA|nr:dirigent protein 24-like [Senna tora]